jgi:hypothetical protein
VNESDLLNYLAPSEDTAFTCACCLEKKNSPFHIHFIGQRELHKFRTRWRYYKVNFNPECCYEPMEILRMGVNELITMAFEGGNPQDKVGVKINHPSFEEPILVPFDRLDRFTATKVVNALEESIGDQVNFTDEFEFETTQISAPIRI